MSYNLHKEKFIVTFVAQDIAKTCKSGIGHTTSIKKFIVHNKCRSKEYRKHYSGKNWQVQYHISGHPLGRKYFITTFIDYIRAIPI